MSRYIRVHLAKTSSWIPRRFTATPAEREGRRTTAVGGRHTAGVGGKRAAGVGGRRSAGAE